MNPETAYGESLMRALLLVGGTLQGRVGLTRLALGRGATDCVEKLNQAESELGITGFDTTIAPRVKLGTINTAIDAAYENNITLRKKMDE